MPGPGLGDNDPGLSYGVGLSWLDDGLGTGGLNIPFIIPDSTMITEDSNTMITEDSNTMVTEA